MARQTISKTLALGEYGDYSVANAADLNFQAADAGNLNQFEFNTGDILLAWNTDAGAQTCKVTSKAAQKTGRTGDIGDYSIGAGEIAVIGPFNDQDGFKQSDGYIYIEASDATVKFAVIQQA